MAYATITDVKDYVQGNGIQLPDDTRIQTLIDRSERDIDWITGSWAVINTTTGRRFDPTTMVAFQATQLKYATCAQVEYRLLHGETFMAKAQHEIVRLQDDQGAAEFRQGTLPYIGPKVIRELQVGGLMRSANVGTVSLGLGRTISPVIGNLSDDAQ
jgi:hypothetical protein